MEDKEYFCGEIIEEPVEEVIQEKKAYKVLAIIGMVLGIVSLVAGILGILVAANITYNASMTQTQIESYLYAAVLIPSLVIELGIAGIIISAIGKKSFSNHGKAKLGLIFSIISIPAAIIGIIVAFVNYTAFLMTVM